MKFGTGTTVPRAVLAVALGEQLVRRRDDVDERHHAVEAGAPFRPARRRRRSPTRSPMPASVSRLASATASGSM